MLEIICIKGVAALHRGVVNTAILTLRLRQKIADRVLASKEEYADDLVTLAARTSAKSEQVRVAARQAHVEKVFKIRSAEHTVHNLRDDLDKIQ